MSGPLDELCERCRHRLGQHFGDTGARGCDGCRSCAGFQGSGVFDGTKEGANDGND